MLLLRRHDGLLADVRFRYLAAKCLAELDEWDEVLGLLGDSDHLLQDDDDDVRGQTGAACWGCRQRRGWGCVWQEGLHV